MVVVVENDFTAAEHKVVEFFRIVTHHLCEEHAVWRFVRCTLVVDVAGYVRRRDLAAIPRIHFKPDGMLIAFGIQLVVDGYAVRGEHTLDFGQDTVALVLVIAYVGIRKWRVVGESSWWSLRIAAKRLQHRLVARYREVGITGNELGTLAALTLGYREELDPTIRQSFQRAGAAHVLAVSGLHTGIIYYVLWQLLTCFGYRRPLYEQKWRRRILSIIIIAAMWGYALLTGLTPSVVRSVIMVTIMQTAYMCYRNPLSLNSVAAAAFLILMVRPTDLYSVSFQLSFAAVTAILLICPKAIHIPIAQEWLSRPMNWIVNLLMVSIAAQLGTLPFTLYYFCQCSNYFLLTNLVVIGLATLITMTAFALLTIGWIPGVGEAIGFVIRWGVWLLNTVVGWIEGLPGAVSIIV